MSLNNIIAMNDELKSIPFLYIENNPKLREYDKDCLELLLGGGCVIADLKDYNIEYHFNAHLREDTFEKIEQFDYILLNTSFTGTSGDLLHNFVYGALSKNLKNKTIINCTLFSVLSGIFEELRNEIIELSEKQNIEFYFPGRDIFAFVKYNNSGGFTLG